MAFGKKSSSSKKAGPLHEKGLGPKTVKIAEKFPAKGAAGNKETGFIQRTAKSATGANMGRAMPKSAGVNSKTAGPKAKGAKKQFGKVPGKRVF
jgi:hypothetical protein